jgi:hypothetical protein
MTEEDKLALAELSRKLDKSASQIVREEVRERLAEEVEAAEEEVAANA